MKPVRIAEARWIESRNRWQIQVQRDGTRKTFVSSLAGRKGKRDCERKADAWLENQTDDKKVSAAFDEYLEDLAHRVSLTRIKDVTSLYRNHIMPVVGNLNLSKVTPQHWQNIVNRCADAGKAKSTIMQILAIASAFSKFCEKCRYDIEPYDSRLISIPKSAKGKSEKRALTPTEFNTLMTDTSKNWHLNAFRFLAVTGLRRGELCALMNSDIDGDLLTVNRSVTEQGIITDGKTANARRTFRLNRQAVTILADQRAMLMRKGIVSPYVFPNMQGDQLLPRAISAAWDRYCEKKGIGVTIHELRHTFISICKADMPLSLLKQVVGHSSSMDTIGIYGHAAMDDYTRASDISSESFDRAMHTYVHTSANDAHINDCDAD